MVREVSPFVSFLEIRTYGGENDTFSRVGNLARYGTWKIIRTYISESFLYYNY